MEVSYGARSVPERMSRLAFSRIVGVNETTIRKAIENGRLSKCVTREEGRIWIGPLDVALKEWGDRDPKALAGYPSAASSVPVVPASSESGGGGEPPSPDDGENGERGATSAPDRGVGHSDTHQVTTIAESRRRLLEAQAQRVEQQVGQKAGELVPAQEVKRQAYEVAKRVRESLFNIPDRLASVLAAESEVGVVHRLLTDEIRVALEGLADELEGP